MPAAMPSGEQIDAFFQKLEQAVPFPEAELAALAPLAVAQEWKSIGATQSVPWIWVMLCELSLVSFLTPNARITPLASFFVFSLSWMFFLHPGARHASNLLRLCRNVLRALERKSNEARAAMWTQLRLQALPNPAAKAALKERLQKLRGVSFRVGTGSLEGVGLKMSSDACRAAAGSCLVEGSQFLQWLQQELGLNKPLAREIRDASAELQNEKGADKLEERIVNKFFAVYKARAIEHVGEGSFTYHLGHPFRNYDFSSTGGGQAETGFFDVFDARVQQQGGAYLVKHEGAKKRGRLKGKHLRRALNWANVMNARGDVAFDAWNTAIDLNALKAAQLIGDFSEKLAEEMSNVIRVTLSLSLSALRREIPVDQRAFTKAFVIAMPRMQTIWLESTSLKAHGEIRDNLPAASTGEKLTAVWRMALAKALQLGRAVMSTNPRGAKKMHFVKRSALASDARRQEFEAVLSALGMGPGQCAAPTAEVADASRPQTVPALVRSAWTSEAAQEAVTTLQQW
ncbi:unnamed protein product [Prorocentrum cordatum]|uniref:Uncharacterized protein n=1 Tax=Prorocentrum cordatum TaxID=2364126 RepID=A0ABN9R8M3_9DINO|nr:unnamed protein product [Polarella glacialis]